MLKLILILSTYLYVFTAVNADYDHCITTLLELPTCVDKAYTDKNISPKDNVWKCLEYPICKERYIECVEKRFVTCDDKDFVRETISMIANASVNQQ
ncbi:unnamed protein product [Heterobilharzia americana]|nr:unnamed protein product [Heterobilharzia americana]CAH8454669.1 unnamed protein product [Heterobilharzia americana]